MYNISLYDPGDHEVHFGSIADTAGSRAFCSKLGCQNSKMSSQELRMYLEVQGFYDQALLGGTII